MNKKLGIVILVILLAASAWFAFGNSNKEASNPEVDLTETPGIQDVSFSCKDGTRFVAAFSTMDSVNILVDGNHVRTLSFSRGDGQRYEDASYSYVFAGEEVTVTTKATGKSTSCEQPVDANYAPVNFGDEGEGSGAQADLTLAVTDNVIGKWQSTADVKSVREFKGGGVLNEIYDGKVISTGKWQAFTGTKLPAEKVSFTIDANDVYLQLTTPGKPTETLNFKLTKLTPEELELLYMERGSMLVYKKI